MVRTGQHSSNPESREHELSTAPYLAATMTQERFEDPEVIYMKRDAVPGSAEAHEAAADEDGGLDEGIPDFRGSATKVTC